MVNQIVLDYLRKWKDSYKLEDLKKKIISSGYSEDEVDEAVIILGLANKENVPVDDVSEINSQVKVGGRKWMKFAGIIGVIFLVLSVFGAIFGFILPKMGISAVPGFLSGILGLIIFFVLFIVGLALIEIFYYGFLKLGKHTGSKLLVFSAKSLMIMMIVFLVLAVVEVIVVFSTISSFISRASNLSGLLAGPAFAPPPISGFASFLGFGTLFLVIGSIGILVALFMLVVQILFYVGLIKIGEQVKFAKIAGFLGMALMVFGIIFSIVSMFTISTTLFTGVPLWILIVQIALSVLGFVNLLLLSLALFDASKKFESD